MVPPEDIDPTTPSDTGVVSTFPSNERTNRQTIENIVAQDHAEGSSYTSAQAGKHLQVSLLQRTGDPTVPADEAALYVKDVSGNNELFFKDEAGVVQQLTAGGITGYLDRRASASAAARTMAAALIMSADVELDNTQKVRWKDAGGTLRDILQVDGSDNLILGLTGAILTKVILRGQAASDLVFDYGSGQQVVWHAGNDGAGSALDAGLFAGIAIAEFPRYDSGFYYVSSTGITMSRGDNAEEAHGLGAVPKEWSAYMICTDAGGDRGYAQNDYLEVTSLIDNNNRGIQIHANATNVGYVVGSAGLFLGHKTVGGQGEIDYAKWDLYLVAQK